MSGADGFNGAFGGPAGDGAGFGNWLACEVQRWRRLLPVTCERLPKPATGAVGRMDRRRVTANRRPPAPLNEAAEVVVNPIERSVK